MAENNVLVTSPPASSSSSLKEGKLFKHKFEAKSCPIERVTIFRFGSALITRQVKLNFTQTGEQKVVINGMTSQTIGNSVRVSGVGHCTIQDVTYKANVDVPKKKREEQQKKIEPEIKALEEKKKVLKKDKEDLDAKKDGIQRGIDRLQKERGFVNKYSESVLRVSQDDKQISKLLQQQTFDAVTDFMMFQVQEQERIQKTLDELDKELKDLNTKVFKVNEQIQETKKLITELRTKKEQNNQVVITIHVSMANTEAELHLQYMVNGAQWTPSYDIRVQSKEKMAEFKLTYYAMIQQKTDEDWIDCNISLSTAAANTTTEPPKLSSLDTTITYQYYQSNFIGSKKRRGFVDGLRKEAKYDERDDYDNEAILGGEMFDDEEEEDDDHDGDERVPQELPEMSTQKATTEKGSTSSLFHIPRAASIPSDNQPHKCTCTEIDLDAQFSYFSVPKLDQNAYLKVKTKNTSDFQLLPGSMNIYVDNNFVSTGIMATINPSEDFNSFLGVDPAIKVEYKAPSYFKESSGFIVKTQSKVTVVRKIVVKNTKATNSDIVIKDQIPKSDDEKIKVQLEYPKLIKEKEYTQSDVPIQESSNSKTIRAKQVKMKEDTGYLEWKLQLKPAEEAEIELKYSVTWPIGQIMDEKKL